MNKKVSIVICTYNRAPFLKRTLRSLRNLNYKNFEVVVVNGPSTDETEMILEKYKDKIKVAKNPYTNLSISRNMGIKLSAGDIIAFIDDDAIPDKYWLDDIVSYYTDDSIGGVGGRVYGPGDDHFQFEKGYVDFWGDADVHFFGPDYNDPKGTKFNMMLGTNCTFSKEALIAVGGFDEYYDYYHDESDLCLRVVQSGYKILNHPRAFIHHEYAKSHIRQNTYDGCRLNWYPIVKNKVYFALKNSINLATDEERENKVKAIRDNQLKAYKVWKSEGKITKDEYIKYVKMCNDGFERGYVDGKNKKRQFNFDLECKEEFLKFDSESEKEILSICLLCKDNIFETIGGTAKHTYELAKGFVNAGHDVHVISQADSEMDWLQDGINVHTILKKKYINIPELDSYPTSNGNLQHSYGVYKKIVQLDKKYGIDVIESALWDYEGAVAAYMLKGKIPVIIRLQTPLLKVIETQHWAMNDDFRLFADFEGQMIRDSAKVIAISDHIRETITDLYGITLNETNSEKVYLGVDENTCESTRNDGNIRILYVGRLERRKGIHTIFEVLPNIMEKYSNVEMRFLGNVDIVDDVLKMTYKQYFEKHYKKEKWASRVFFLGQVDNSVKDQEFRDCDIFVAPSLYESFGIISIEAMSAGKPVIGCKIGGMQEVIEDGVTGFTVEVENSKEFEEKLACLIENTDLREKMGKAGFERFEAVFSNKAMIANTQKVYEAVLNKAGEKRLLN